MLLANPSMPLNALANTVVAPGAMSWTFSIIARPSSVEPAGPSWRILALGARSPEPIESARPFPTCPAESESTPTVTPAPVRPVWTLAVSAFSDWSASLSAVPW